jgi:hypothetical protein
MSSTNLNGSVGVRIESAGSGESEPRRVAEMQEEGGGGGFVVVALREEGSPKFVRS